MDKMTLETVWLANALSTGLIVAILSYFLKRMFKQYDDRLAAAEKEAGEIKRNYLKRFQEVHETISEENDKTREHFDVRIDDVRRKMDEVNRDKMEFRLKQVEKMATIENKVDNIVDNLIREQQRNNKP